MDGFCADILCGTETDCDDLSGTAEDLCEFVQDIADDGQGTFDWKLAENGAEITLQLTCGDSSDTALTFNRALAAPVGDEGSSVGLIAGATAGIAALVAAAVVAFRMRAPKPVQVPEQKAETPPQPAVAPKTEMEVEML